MAAQSCGIPHSVPLFPHDNLLTIVSGFHKDCRGVCGNTEVG